MTARKCLAGRQSLVSKLTVPGGSYITNHYDTVARLLFTKMLDSGAGVLDSEAYSYNPGNQRTQQVFTAGNTVDYTYDDVGQLKTAKGKEPGGTSRLHEQKGYTYDAAGNLNYRTNNAFVQTFNVNTLNELTTVTRSGTLTVAGAASSTATSVTVNALLAALYGDAAFAREGFPLVDGVTNFTAIAQDSYGQSDTNTVSVNLAATVAFQYDLNGNLRTNGTRVFEYDDENQLVRVMEPGAWKSEFTYDGKLRRRIRQEYGWAGGAWSLTNTVRYVYDGNLVIQERDGNNVPTVTYTRGKDLSGTMEGAGGIGGMLARTDHGQSTVLAQALYHADGNGNIMALVATNGLLLGRYHYDPYGNLLAAVGQSAAANLYRFSSKEWHPNSGLVYYLYRFYDAGLQRWVNRDPLNEPGFILETTGEYWELNPNPESLAARERDEMANLYAFVLNDPVDYFDPEGRSIFRPIKAWWCRRKMDKWYKECIKEVPPCTRGIGEGSKGSCPFDEPGQNSDNHWFVCEDKRLEKLKDCLEKSKDMFKACMGVTTSPPTPKP